MDERVISVKLDDKDDTIAEHFAKYAVTAIPVVDENERMQGTIIFKNLLGSCCSAIRTIILIFRDRRYDGKIGQLWKKLLQSGLWKLGLFFAFIGPGIITSNVDNDAGGITTYSLAGAQYGLKLIWILIPVTVALIIIQEMCARMGVVSGKGLSDLIRERFGAKITFYLMIILFWLIWVILFQNLRVLPPVWNCSESVNIFLCPLALFLCGG